MALDVTVVVGNPKPRGHTYDTAVRIGSALGDVGTVLDLVDLGPGLLQWGDPDVAAARERAQTSDVVVVASPTYKATYTGLLKLFLETFDGGAGLQDVVAVPLQLGGSATHALSPELHLRPLLAELGATIPAPALYVIQGAEPDPAEQAWLERWGPVVRRAAGGS